MSSKIALLIDAENMSYRELPYILKEVGRQGQIILQAVYGDWEQPHLQTWHEAAKDYDFHIRHQTSDPFTKNSTDMKLIMDAMEVLYRTPADCFCLVTNDADYVPLCDKIHEAGKSVIGVGYQRASEALIRSCDQFIFIRNGKTPVQPTVESLVVLPSDVPTKQPKTSKPIKQPKTPKPIKQPKTSKLTNQADKRKLISKAFAKAPQTIGKWVRLSTLGTALSQVQKGFKPSNYGHANLSKLLQSMPDLVDLQVNGKVVQSARLKNKIAVKPLKLNTLQTLISKAFAKAPQNTDRWVTFAELGMALRQMQADFKPNNYGHSTLKKLLQSMPHFIELRVNGSVNSARLRK